MYNPGKIYQVKKNDYPKAKDIIFEGLGKCVADFFKDKQNPKTFKMCSKGKYTLIPMLYLFCI